MREVGIQLTAEEASVLFETFDTDENGGLDLQEFTKAIKYPSKVEQWVDSLPLSKLFAHCLSFKEGYDSLREVSRLSSDELRASMNAYCESLQIILPDAVGQLKKCFAQMDRVAAESASEAGSKFQTFKMSSGKVEDFHIGLQGRVGESSCDSFPFWSLTCNQVHFLGAPHPNLSKGMEEEHCVKAGYDDEFISSNYGVRTNPSKEYEIATGKRVCPPEDTLDKKGRKVRVVRAIEELKKLKLVHKAALTEEEIVAVVCPLALPWCASQFYALRSFRLC